MSTTVQTTGTGSVYIQNLGFTGNSIIATNENGSVNFVPNGTGVIGFGDVGFNNGAISTTLDNLDLVLSPDGTGTVKTDNLQLDGNTISTTNVDGDLVLAPNGTGAVLTGNLQLAGNTLSTTDVDGDLVLAPNGNGNVGVGTSSPNAKLHVQGPFMQNDALSYFVRKTMPSVSVSGTYSYVLLGKAATNPATSMSASYAIGKIVFRRGDTGAYNYVDVINVMSSRGYDNETFSVNIEHCGTTTISSLANGTKFVRLVKCTYDGIEYHAVEISGNGGGNTHEQTFEGYSVDAGLLFVGEGLVSNVTSYGNLGVVSKGDGNVGIGTSTPTAKLHITPSSGAHGLYVNGDSEGGHAQVYFNGSTYGLYIKTNNTLNTRYALRVQNSANTEMLYVSNGGNVGIGTSSPGELLDVRGNLRIGNSGDSSYIAFYGTTNDGVGSWNHTYIGERKYGGTEQSELLLWKGNDAGSSGPDRIRYTAAGGHLFQTTGTATGSFETVATNGQAVDRMIIEGNKVDIEGYLRIGMGGVDAGSHHPGRLSLYIATTYSSTDTEKYGWWIGAQNETASSGDNDLHFTVNRNGVLSAAGYMQDSYNGVMNNFTGQHRTFVNDISLSSIENYEGLIVCASQNAYVKMSGGIAYGQDAITLNESLPVVTLSKTMKDKRCFGVISSIEDPEQRKEANGNFVSLFTKEKGDTRVYINSVGEGAIWVVSGRHGVGGTLESGDYITTSNITGYGCLQDDDLLHNYTVAKITMDCDFDPPRVPKMTILKDSQGDNILDNNNLLQWTELLNEEGNVVYEDKYKIKYITQDGNLLTKEEFLQALEHDTDVYIAALVGCTYHCG